MKPEQVNISISRIKEVEYFINESIELKPGAQMNINFQVTTNFKLDDKTVEMLLTAQFAEITEGIVLLKIKTSNVFSVLELADFHKPESETYDIPDNVMVTFLSLSVSHTRALLAKNAQGTTFAGLYIPIVNPADLFNQLFKGAQG
jgi:Holliday junction resolvase